MTTSVALCSYNGEQFLEEQLNSILHQSIPVNEIVICDDCSNDKTVEIINKYVEHFPVVKLISNEQNIGGKKNFEKAILACENDVIFLADQDDIWNPNKVERTLHYFEKFPNHSGVFHNASLIAPGSFSGKLLLWDVLNFDLIKDVVSAEKLFKAQLFYRNFVTGACLAIKKSACNNLLPLKLLNNMWHDEWIALNLSKDQQLGLIDEPLISYRIHGSQQTKLPAELSNNELKAVKKAIFTGDYDRFPLYSYFHFNQRIQFINIVRQVIEVDEKLVREMYQLRRNGLVKHLLQFNFIKRKIEILKWLLNGKQNLTIKDLLTI